MENDLRLVELQKREGFQMDPRGGVLTVVVVGILLSIALYVNNKVQGSIDTSGFSAAENTTFASIKANILDALDIQSVGLIILGVSVLVGFLYLMLR